MKGLIPLIVVVTAGCMAPEGESAGPANDNAPPAFTGDGSCDPAAAQKLIGKERSAEVEAEALRLTGAKKARWIKPGDAVTMDYSPTRLNIDLDDAGRITKFHCG